MTEPCTYFPFQVVSNKTSSSKMIRMSCDVAIRLGPSLLELLRAIYSASQRKQKGKKVQDVDKTRLHEIVSHFPVLIDCFTSVLHIYAISEQSRYAAFFFVIPQCWHVDFIYNCGDFIWWLFRKLKRVKEVYKECKLQDVFDVTLTAVIHRVFKRGQPRLQIALNDSEVSCHLYYFNDTF